MDFLDQENVWRMPHFFSKLWKANSDPASVSVDMQFCTILWPDNIQGLTNSKKTIQIFLLTAFLAFRNIPLPRHGRLAYRKSFTWNSSVAVKMSVHFYL